MEIKQKILMVHNHYQISGGEDTAVANEKKLLESHGHEVVLYSRSNSEIKNFSGLKKLALPFVNIFNPKTFFEVKSIIKTQHIDIVHVHNALLLVSPAVYYAAFSCNVPIVQTLHNFRLSCPGGMFYKDGDICEECVSRGLRCAVRHGCYRESKMQTLACVISTKIHRMLRTYNKLNYICLSSFNRDKFLDAGRADAQLSISPSRVFVKSNFTFDNFSLIDSTRQYFLFTGRVERAKGIDLLLRAFDGMPDKKLVIAGAGDRIAEYEKAAGENVKFVGFLDKSELCRVLRGAKAVIVPSQWYEGFPMAVIEAYAAHKPVIAGNIGNLKELVDNEETGLIYQYNSVKSLQDAVRQFDNSPASQAWGENAYRKYVENFSPDKNYEALAEIYNRVSELNRRNSKYILQTDIRKL